MSPRHSNVTTSTHGFDYMICITQSQIHLFKPTQRTSKSAPKFLPESQDENVCQPLCIDSQGHGTRKLITKTYIKWINRTSHCHHGYPIARHTSSVLKSEIFNPTITKPQRERLNSSQEDREGRNTIWSNYINKAHCTSRSCQIKNMRERSNT